MAEVAKDMFKPLRGPGGRGRQRIWIDKDNAKHFDIKKNIRPIVSNATAGSAGTKETKLVPLVQHPNQPSDRDGFVLAFVVENTTMRSIDVDKKTDGGRFRFNFEIPQEIAGVHDQLDEHSLRYMCTQRPGFYMEYPKNGDNIKGEKHTVDNFVKWWTRNEPMFQSYERDVRDELELTKRNGKEDPKTWIDEEHAKFENLFYERIAIKVRTVI